MRKVCKFKIITIILILIIICIAILLIKNISIDKSIETYSNNDNKYKILVDVEDSKLFLFQNDELIKTYKCSGGKSSTPSPIGTWIIISKAKWGEGFGRKLAWF